MASQQEGSQDAQEGTDNPHEGLAEERHDLGGSKRGKSSSESSSKPKRKRSCPVYFGVRSYLHQFYEDHTFKDPSVYEDDEQFLQQPRRRRRCIPIWWKVFMWVGVNLLILGVIGILVGYLVPQRHVLISSSTDPNGDVYIDENAQKYNTTLDMCTLIGLILFCVGGVALTMSLLFTSFMSHYCGEDWRGDELDPIKVPLNKDDNDPGPTSPLQMGIPVSGKVKNVQPEKKSEQQMLTQTFPTPSE